MNECSCSPKHGPGLFTFLKNLFVWMIWSFSKTFELMAGPCSPKHGPNSFTVLKNHFVWMLCSQLITFQFMAGPRSPKSSVTAGLISQRWKLISLWCCADFQQRSNERMVVLPQTDSRSFHGVEDSFHLDGMKLVKNNRIYGWAVLSQTRPNSFHGVEETFCLMLSNQLKLMVGLQSPISPVPAQLFFQGWIIISLW